MFVIGLCGFKGSGKTYLAERISDVFHDTVILNFADPLKEIVKLFGVPKDELDGKDTLTRFLKETPHPNLSRIFGSPTSPRDALIRIGMGLREIVHEDIWVKMLEDMLIDSMRKGHNVIIGDVRLKNEIDLVRRYDGKLVLVKSIDKMSRELHRTETEWQSENFDYVFDNTDREKFEHNLKEFIEWMKT